MVLYQENERFIKKTNVNYVIHHDVVTNSITWWLSSLFASSEVEHTKMHVFTPTQSNETLI